MSSSTLRISSGTETLVEDLLPNENRPGTATNVIKTLDLNLEIPAGTAREIAYLEASKMRYVSVFSVTFTQGSSTYTRSNF